MPYKTVFYVEVNARIRSLFTVRIKKRGDLLITLPPSGRYLGPATSNIKTPTYAPVILTDRISIHPSLKSPTLTTIKRTLVLDNKRELTQVALTDAIKGAEPGYRLIFGARCNKMDLPNNKVGEVKMNNNSTALIRVRGFNETTSSLVCLVLLGHPDGTFPPPPEGMEVIEETFGQFKIIVVSRVFPIPAHETGSYIFSFSTPPEIVADEHKEFVATMTKAFDGEEALEASMQVMDSLIENYIRALLPSANADETKSLNELLNTLTYDRVRKLAPELAKLATQWVTHESPPNPQ